MEEFSGLINDVERSGQLAAALEVCGWPKPGNVHRMADFKDTRFEHFIVGSIALGPALREAAIRGVETGLGKIAVQDVELGLYIKKAILDARRWHTGGNTHMGTSLLLIPMATAAGLSFIRVKEIKPSELRGCFGEVVRSTTPKDASEVYEAITAISGFWTGKLDCDREPPDLTDKDAKRKLIEGNITLYDVMTYSSGWDNIAREWATDMEISFEIGYPTLIRVHKETGDMNIATVHTFLTILSRFPDTFIARKIGVRETTDIREAVKIGLKKAVKISKRANKVLELGGLLTDVGRKALFDFDKSLRSPENELNPGTSADLTASSLMIAILCGLRP